MAEQIFLLPRKRIHNTVFRQIVDIEVVCASSQEYFVLGVKDFEPTHFFRVPFSIKFPFCENEVLIFGIVDDFLNVLLSCSMMLV